MAMKPFVIICSGLWVYFSYFDQTVTEISIIFKKITYMCYTRVAKAMLDKNHEQHRQKVGIAHSCHEILHLRAIDFSWAGHLSPPRVSLDPNSIFFISLQKITQWARYFVCYSYSYHLRINGNHLSMIKKYTISQWFIYPPGQKRPALC